jgi:FMN-dependent oxidoreductase (nitrilotriacetate monooxygenase family)
MSVQPNPLLWSAFVSATTAQGIQGLWRQPDAGQTDFNQLDHWVELARVLEKGKFDLMFFADVIGLLGNHRGDWRKQVEAGLHFPTNDPSAVVSALAFVTEHLGIAFTNSILQEHPFSFARRMSTLDHLTGGRVAWNIVTNGLASASRNFGLEGLTPHDERYVWADEYAEVTYKLWEGSWDEGALVQDRATGIHADYDKIHKIFHEGERYKVEGPHMVSPSPQRTPFLFQAGSSPAGREFASRHAEAVFFNSSSPNAAAELISDIRGRAVKHGRRGSDMKFFVGLHFVVGSTEEEAQRKSAELNEWIDYDAHLAQMGGALGIDLGDYDLDSPVGTIETEGYRNIAQWITESITDREPLIRDVATLIAHDGRVVGTPEQIADTLEGWRDAGVDGVNMFTVTRPGSYVEFTEYVTPILQKRGLARTEYEEGTLRRKIFGHDYLPDTHPAAAYRGAFTSSPR